MSLKVTVDTKGLERVIQQEPGRVDKWLRGVAQQMVGDIKLSFNSGPAGRTYKRGPKNKRGAKTHVASSPGYAPNVDIGTLRASIKAAPAGHLAYQISDGVNYGTWLEHGTARMAARPFMGPVFAAWEKKIEQDARENLDLE
jgi:hypothetical protein